MRDFRGNSGVRCYWTVDGWGRHEVVCLDQKISEVAEQQTEALGRLKDAIAERNFMRTHRPRFWELFEYYIIKAQGQAFTIDRLD